MIPTVTLPVDPAEIRVLKPGEAYLHGGDVITLYAVQGHSVSVYAVDGNVEISAPAGEFDPAIRGRISRRMREAAAGRFG